MKVFITTSLAEIGVKRKSSDKSVLLCARNKNMYSKEVIQRANFSQQIDKAIGKIRGDRGFYLEESRRQVESQNERVANQAKCLSFRGV